MSTCFVIQPFDRGRFDKRYEDCFRPAIEKAGLVPYRVDGDPGAEVLISSIESGIKNSSVCLADITLDNANVWYELGFALALGKPVVMVCAEDRQKFPFDIQHRQVIVYKTDSTQDFNKLEDQIIATLKARLSKAEILKQAAESELVSDVAGLSHSELVFIAAVASEAEKPTSFTGLQRVKQSVERQGITAVGTQLAIRRLSSKTFIELGEVEGEEWGPYDGVALTDQAWDWIENNERLFKLDSSKDRVAAREAFADDDIPF